MLFLISLENKFNESRQKEQIKKLKLFCKNVVNKRDIFTQVNPISRKKTDDFILFYYK